jgi:hypothetical protein
MEEKENLDNIHEKDDNLNKIQKEKKEDDNLDKKITKKLKIKKSEIWKYVSGFLLLLLIVSVAYSTLGDKNVEGAVSADEAASIAVDYINANLLQPGTSAELKEVTEKNGVYAVDLSIGGQDYTSYVTKDTGILFTSGIDMNEEVEAPANADTNQPAAAPQVTKSDKPEVELFIMSHCPYGTQAEKGMIPAVKALGDTIDFKLRFVYYAMHPTQGEVEEQLNQYCIQEEQEDKLLDYLECFLTEGDGEGCLDAIKIDEDMLNTCVEKADAEFEVMSNLEDKTSWMNGRFPKFNVDKELNELYGVGGSPTLVINGAQAQSGRDSISYLNTICASFNNAPSECDVQLEAAQPSPGFGYETTSGASTTAQCG